MVLQVPSNPMDEQERKLRDLITGSLGPSAHITETFEGGRTARVHFGDVDAYMDVSLGPGDNPIVGRGSGMYLFNRINALFGEQGPTGKYTYESGWDVLAQVTAQARRAVGNLPGRARDFATELSGILGANQLESGEGFAAQHLPYQYEQLLPEAALRRFASTYYTPEQPSQALAQVFPGMIATGTARGGMMPVIEQEALRQAAIGGQAYGGGKRKASGVNPYETTLVGGGQWGTMTTATGLTHRAQLHDIIMPLTGNIAAGSEGMVGVRAGTMTEQRRTRMVALTGWDTDMLSQVGEVRRGMNMTYGSEANIIMNKAGEAMTTWRAPHAQHAQIAGARISLPQSYANTTWYQGLSQTERAMYELTGGVVRGGQAVPALMLSTIERNAAGGAVAFKGMGEKAQAYEVDIGKQIGGLTEAQARSVSLLYEDSPKDIFTRMAAIGSAHGILTPGQALVQNGVVNEDLARQISEVIANNTRTLTRTFEVTSGMAEPYLSGAVPGILADKSKQLDSGNWQFTRQFDAYVGPSFEWARVEYPGARSVVNPEEMAHMMATNPALAQRVLEKGYQAEGHLGVSRAFWASQGVIGGIAGAQDISKYQTEIQAMAVATQGQSGALARQIAESSFANVPFALGDGRFAPSARDIMQMSATNPANEEVSRLVTSWERYIVANDPSYNRNVAEAMGGGTGWAKQIQSYNVPGVAGPGIGRADVNVGTVMLGENQLRRLAREVYGHNPSDKEMRIIRATIEQNEVISKATRFPQSDVYRQNEVFLRLGVGGGANEIATHPLVAAVMRGDYDSDIYRIFTTAFDVTDKHGHLSVNNRGMGPVATEAGILTNIIDMMEQVSPVAVQNARKEVAAMPLMAEPHITEEMRLLATARRVNYYANELGKHFGKEQTPTTGATDAARVLQEALRVTPDWEGQQFKAETLIASKGMMGRSYNTYRRDMAERARRMYGADSEEARTAFEMAAAGYQPALDVGGRVGKNLPLGRFGADDDPVMSWGSGRFLEAAGSGSFLHGGGYMAAITGDYTYERYKEWDESGLRRVEKQGYRAPWIFGIGNRKQPTAEDALYSIRGVVGQTAMFTGEWTPKQTAMMLGGGADLEQAIASAREWIGADEGKRSAEQLMRSAEGVSHMAKIWRAAGLISAEDIWQSQAPLVGTLRDEFLLRTGEQIRRAELGQDQGYRNMVQQQLETLDPSFEALTGQSLSSAIESARETKAKSRITAGQVYSKDRSAMGKATALAKYLPEVAGEFMERGGATVRHETIRASELQYNDAMLFSSLLMRKHDVTGGWGTLGTRIHDAFDKELRTRREGILSEKELTTRGKLSDIGIESDVGFSLQPDILVPDGEGGYKLIDIKSYDGTYDEQQLRIYAAMLGETRGLNITSAEYLATGRPPGKDKATDEEMATWVKGIVDQYEAGTLKTQKVELADTQEERMKEVRKIYRQALKRREEIEPLTERITREEAQGTLGGATYQGQIATGESLLRTARKREGLDISADEVAAAQSKLSPLEQFSQQYRINLASMGVTDVQVLNQEDYAAYAKRYEGAEGSGGLSTGTSVVVRQPTVEELENAGAKEWDLIRRRAAHEAGHVLYRTNKNVRVQAQASIDPAIAEGRLDPDKLKAQYGDNWRDQAGGEIVAMAIGASYGQLPTYSKKVTKLDVMLSRIGSEASMGGGTGSFDLGGAGGGGGDDDDVAFLAAPSGQGGGGWNDPQVIASVARIVQQAVFGNKRDPLQSQQGQRIAWEVAQGNLSALGGEAMGHLTGSGKVGEVGALQAFGKWMMGGGGAPTGQAAAVATQLFGMAGNPQALAGLMTGEWSTGLTVEQGERGVKAMADKMTRPPVDIINKFMTELDRMSENMTKHADVVQKATENYDQLNSKQRAALKLVQKDAGSALAMRDKLAELGPIGIAMAGAYSPTFDAAQGIVDSGSELINRQYTEAYDELRKSQGLGGQIRAAGGWASSMGNRLLKGWELQWAQRTWNMFGGAAIQAQGDAMQQEMALGQAAAAWSGGGISTGTISRGLMGMQATRQAARASMGRGSWMAYGPIQEALAGRQGEAAGLAGPALSAGLVAGHFLGGPVGLGVGLVSAGVGMQNFARSIASDPLELAYRAGGTGWEGFTAEMAALSAGMLPGMKEGTSYNPLTHPISGTFNAIDWMATNRRTLTGAVRDWREEAAVGAADVRAGHLSDLRGNPQGTAMALRQWAEQSGSFLGVETLAGMAGQWQQYGPSTPTTRHLPTELFEQLSMRGMSPDQVGQLNFSLGGTRQTLQPFAQAMVNAPLGAQNIMAQYTAAAQAGLVGVDYFTQNIGNLTPMSGWQQGRFNQMMGGDRYMWSRYAAGMDLGLPQAAMDMLPARQDWMMTMEPDTGLPLHTTTGARYGGNLLTGAARSGGLRGIQWEMMQQQFSAARQQEQFGWDRLQLGYTHTTGGRLAGYGGDVSPGFAQLAASVGGVWGLQDAQRGLQWGRQQEQFGLQQRSLDISNAQWNENWQARYSRLGQQSDWRREDFSRQREKWAAQDEHWLFQYGMQENMAQLRFGWQMEDMDEQIRFSTGRNKLRLMRQKERAVITESMRGQSSEESKDYWEKMKDFREEDAKLAEERHEQQTEWAKEDMERDKKHHDERSKLAQDELNASRRHAEEMHRLEERKIQFERAYYKEVQQAQAREREMMQRIAELQRNLRQDQYQLQVDAQDAIAQFTMHIRELGSVVRKFGDDASKARAAMGSGGGTSSGSTSGGGGGMRIINPQPGDDRTIHDIIGGRDSGGPVGLFSTADQRYGVGATETATSLEAGEFVVPRHGMLVARDERVVEVLERIAGLLQEGNGRFTIMVQQPEKGVESVSTAIDAAYRQ